MENLNERMVTQHLKVSIKTLDEAPKYESDVKMIKIDHAIVVKKGTVCGGSTVDLQCTDLIGNKYLIMVTASLLKTVVSCDQ